MQINKKKALTAGISLAVILFLIFGGYFLGKYLKSPKTVAKVGKEKITETDLAMELAFNSKAPTDQEKLVALKQLINCKIAQNEADKLDITVSDAEVGKSITDVIGDKYDKYSDFQKDVIRDDTRCRILEFKVRDHYVAWADGNYLAINVPANDVEADSQAEALATQLANDISNGKIKFDQAKAQLTANSAFGSSKNSLISSSFDKNSFLNNYDIFSDQAVKASVFDYLKTAPSGDTAAYNFSSFIGQVFAEGETTPVYALPAIVQKQTVKTSDGKTASRLLVIDVNNKQQGEFASYDDYTKAKYKEYKVSYKINSELNSKKDKTNVALASAGVSDLGLNQFVAGIYYIDQKGNKIPLDLTSGGKSNASVNINGSQGVMEKASTDKYTYSSDKKGTTQILLPQTVDNKVAQNLPQNMNSASGYWSWDARGTSDGSQGSVINTGTNKAFSLGTITNTGKAHYNEFVWRSSYLTPTSVTLLSPDNGALLLANNVLVQAEVSSKQVNSYKIMVRYKPTNNSKWLETSWHPGIFTISGTPQTFELKDLKKATKYEWQAKSTSVDGAEDDWTSSSTFMTARDSVDIKDNILIATATSENIDNSGDITFNGKTENADFYVWDFGDGNKSEDLAGTASTNHVYETGGEVTANLTAYKYVAPGSWYNKQKDYSGRAMVAQKEVKFFVNLPVTDYNEPTTESEVINAGGEDNISTLNESSVALAGQDQAVLGSEANICVMPVIRAINGGKAGQRIETVISGRIVSGNGKGLSCGDVKYSINWGDTYNTADNQSGVGARTLCRIDGRSDPTARSDNYFYHTYKYGGTYKIIVTAHHLGNDGDCIKQISYYKKITGTVPPGPGGSSSCSLANAGTPSAAEHNTALAKQNVDFSFKITGADGASSWKINFGDGKTGTATGNSPVVSHKYAKTGGYKVVASGFYKGGEHNQQTLPCSPASFTFNVNVTGSGGTGDKCLVKITGPTKLTVGESTYIYTQYDSNSIKMTFPKNNANCKPDTSQGQKNWVKCSKEGNVTIKIEGYQKGQSTPCDSVSKTLIVSASGGSGGGGGTGGGGTGGGGTGGGGSGGGTSCDNKVWEIRNGECKFVTDSCKTAIDNCKCGIKSVKVAPDSTNPLKYTFTVLGAGVEAKAFKVNFGDGSADQNQDSKTFSYTYKKSGSYKVVISSWPSSADRNSGNKACDKFSTKITARSCNTGTFTSNTYSGDTTAGPIKITFSNSGASKVTNYKLSYGVNGLVKESPTFAPLSTNDYPKGTYRPTLEGFDADGASCGVVSLDKQMRFTGPSTSSECTVGKLVATPAEGEATTAKPLSVKFTSTGNTGGTYYRLKWGDNKAAGEATSMAANLSFEHSYVRPNWGSADGSYTAILQAYKNNPVTGTLTDCGSVSTVVKITNYVNPGDVTCAFGGTLTAKPKKGDAELAVVFNGKVKKASEATKEPNRWHISYGDYGNNPGHGSATFDATIAQLNKKNMKHTYKYTQDYSVVLSGTYNGVSCGSIATTVKVTGSKTPPTEICTIGTLTVKPTAGKVNDQFSFDVTGMNNSKVIYIDYGDGVTEQKSNFKDTKLTLSHKYTAPSPTEGYKTTITGSLGIGSDLKLCGSQTVYVKISGTSATGQYLCSDSDQCIFGGATCPTGLNCYNNDTTCANQCKCVGEGESLGPMTSDNNKKCCTGLVEKPPTGVVGNRGTCEKPVTGNTCPSDKVTCSDGSCAATEADCPVDPGTCEAGEKKCNGSCIPDADECLIDPGLDGISLSASEITAANPLITNFTIKDKDGNEIEASNTNYKIEIIQVGFDDSQTEAYDGRPFKFCGPDNVTTYKAKAVRIVTDSAGSETRIVSNEVTIVVNPSVDKDNCKT